MVSPSTTQRNASRTQSEGRAGRGPQPDDSYSYQPSPEPSQYPAFDNTQLRNASPCSFHSSISPWMKWMRTTLLSSLVMYSMLSRLITLSPTRSNLLMVHLLPPKSRAGTPRRIPRPGGRRDRAEAEGGACCKEVVSAPQILATLPLC